MKTALMRNSSFNHNGIRDQGGSQSRSGLRNGYLAEANEEDDTMDDDGYNWFGLDDVDYDLRMNIPQFRQKPGVKCNLKSHDLPIKYSSLFLTQDVLSLITDSTNSYANQYFENNRKSKKEKSRDLSWSGADSILTKGYIGILIGMGLVQLNEIEGYWSTEPLFHNLAISSVMSRNTFQAFSKFLHLTPPNTGPPLTGKNLLESKYLQFSNLLLAPCTNLFIPEQAFFRRRREDCKSWFRFFTPAYQWHNSFFS